MANFMRIAFFFLVACTLTASAIKCLKCTDEQSCKNPDQIECDDSLGCQKLTNTKPEVYVKGCFPTLGKMLVDQNQCKETKINDIQGNYCRCNDKALCNSASTYSFGVLGATAALAFVAKMMV